MRIGLIQTRTGIDPAANADVLADGIAALAAGGARMVFTPEMSGLLDRNRERAASSIVTEDADPVLARVREAARRSGCWVHLGSLALAGGEGGRLLNRGFLIDASGAIVARYDKIHLFDVDLPTGESWRESASYAPGREAVVADTPVGRLGLAICYDLRFPDLFRALSDAGARVLSVPAAFTVPTGEAHWHILLRARAIEAGAFVVAAAQAGLHDDGRRTFGHSLVIGPWGEVLLDMGADEGRALVDIDVSAVDDVRARVPALRHRQPIGSVRIAG